MKLKILHNDIDYTLKLSDFTGQPIFIDLANDLLIGFHKPLRNIYFEIEDGSEEGALSVQYYKNGSFQSHSSFEDDTLGFHRSGLLTIPEVSQDSADLDASGVKKYWLKISLETPAQVSFNGINLVLSNDKDFGFIPNIKEYLPNTMTSWIGFHQEARDMIVQAIRNSGKTIFQHADLDPRQIDVFDLLDIDEFRNASKYLALHLVFDYLSKSNDDTYAIKAARYFERYIELLNTNLVSIDSNDNGVADQGESNTVQFIRIRRE